MPNRKTISLITKSMLDSNIVREKQQSKKKRAVIEYVFCGRQPLPKITRTIFLYTLCVFIHLLCCLQVSLSSSSIVSKIQNQKEHNNLLLKMASAATPSIDKDTFFRRIRQLYNIWNKVNIGSSILFHFPDMIIFSLQSTAEEVANLSRCDAIVAYVGKEQEELYYKTAALQVCIIVFAGEFTGF